MRRAVPTISAITICKNSAATIERALLSVARSSYAKLQYVIVDGGSTDGTLAVIERHRAHVTQLVSEPDGGISDALNKAIALSDGEYHIIVHADDELLPGALERLAEAAQAADAQVICGRALVVSPDDRLVRIFRPEPAKLLQKMSIPHMGSLIRRAAWEAVGGYDVRRRIAMDHHFMLKILRKYGAEAFKSIDHPVARYSLGGVSDRQVIRGFRELRQNLIEAGVGRLHAYRAYGVLVCKAHVARLIRRT
jgi:glycosyltransferase involved in cell wall biosynthesis